MGWILGLWTLTKSWGSMPLKRIASHTAKSLPARRLQLKITLRRLIPQRTSRTYIQLETRFFTTGAASGNQELIPSPILRALPFTISAMVWRMHFKLQHSSTERALTSYSYYTAWGGPGEGPWRPVSQLRRTDADVSIFFLMPNDIRFEQPCDAPLFWAHQNGSDSLDDSTYFMSDYYVNPIACTDQHQFCNPTNSQCTPLTASSLAIAAINQTGMNAFQQFTAQRIGYILRWFNMFYSIGGRKAAALRAQFTPNGNYQAPLPTDQWHIEMAAWFAIGLAKLQRGIVEYASGPSNIVNGAVVILENNPAAQKMCYAQNCAKQPAPHPSPSWAWASFWSRV